MNVRTSELLPATTTVTGTVCPATPGGTMQAKDVCVKPPIPVQTSDPKVTDTALGELPKLLPWIVTW